ncbi:MAG: deoxyribose-phosphate aldolase [Candidatus Margulisiibacteriota bacterium]
MIKIEKPSDLSQYIDHTNLSINATKEDIQKLCEEAKQYHFFSICIRPDAVELARDTLTGSFVNVCAVVGFPKEYSTPENCHFGSMPTSNILQDVKTALKDGADELDMVISLDALKKGDYQVVENDIAEVKKAARDKLLKVIIEARVLTDEQKKKACQIALSAGADFVKTSTGFVKDKGGKTLGATVEDVKLMRDIVGPNIGVKASGGIGDFEKAKTMIEAGANRLGCSSSVKIVGGV